MGDEKKETEEKAPQESRPTPTPGTLKGTILVVDDDPVIRKMLKIMLKKAGLEVVEAGNGAEGLQKMSLFKDINVGLIDIDMPKINGIQFVKMMLAQEAYAHIPFIMVTAKSDQHTIMQAIKAGAKDYVVKPIDQSALIEKIKKHLQ